MMNTTGYCDKCGILIKDSICEINSGMTYLSWGHELCENCERELSLIRCFNIIKPNNIRVGEKINDKFAYRYCGKPVTKKLIYDSKYNKIYNLLTRPSFIYFNRCKTNECIVNIEKTRKYWSDKSDNDIYREMSVNDISGWGSTLFRRLYKKDRIKICDRFLGYINSNEIFHLVGDDRQELSEINKFFGFDILVMSNAKKRYINDYFKNKDIERFEDEEKYRKEQNIAEYREQLKELRSGYRRNAEYIKGRIIEYSNDIKQIKETK